MSTLERDIAAAPQDSLHQRPGHLLRRVHQSMVAAFSRLTAGYDITNVQFAALKAVAALGPATQRSIADYIAMEPSNMHSLLRRLEERRLISIRPDRGDARRSVIRLTAAGRALLHELDPLDARLGPAFMAALDEREQAEFVRLLAKLAFGPRGG